MNAAHTAPASDVDTFADAFMRLSAVQSELAVRCLEVDGKPVVVGHMDKLAFDVWPDEGGLFLQVLPAGEAMAFENVRFVGNQADRIFGRVFSGIQGLRCAASLSGWRKDEYGCNPRVARRSDPKRFGMDCFNIQLYGLKATPDSAGLVLEALRVLDQILAKRLSPLERG